MDLERLLNTPPADLHIEPLAGLTNQSYKLTQGEAAYVLRLPGTGSARYLDRSREAHNARLAAQLGLGPEVLYFGADGTQLTRFIPGQPLTAARLRRPALLVRVAALLCRLHHSGVVFQGVREPFAQLDEYLALTTASPLYPALCAARRTVEPLRLALARAAEPLVPCHSDPAPANFLLADSGRLYLLDWEYAAQAVPLWDLADLSVEVGLSEAEDRLLLAVYDGGLTSQRLARLQVYQVLLELIGAAWAALQPVLAGYAANRLTLAQNRLPTALSALPVAFPPRA